MGRRPATPSAIVSVGPVVMTRCSWNERVIAGAPRGWTQITSTPGASAFSTWPTPVAIAPPPSAIRTASKRGVHQLQADRRRALAGLQVQAVFDQPDAVVARDGHRPLAGQLEVAVHQLQLRAERADALELGRRREAGRHDLDVEPPAAGGPGEGLAEVARARAHRGAGERARDQLGAAALEAADRVRRFELDAHRAPEGRLQRVAPVQRRVEEDRVDHPAGRADASEVEARFRHGAQNSSGSSACRRRTIAP